MEDLLIHITNGPCEVLLDSTFKLVYPVILYLQCILLFRAKTIGDCVSNTESQKVTSHSCHIVKSEHLLVLFFLFPSLRYRLHCFWYVMFSCLGEEEGGV